MNQDKEESRDTLSGDSAIAAPLARSALKLELYRTALETRNLEIKLFWQRSNYFLVLNTAVAVGFLSRDLDDPDALLLAVVGLIASILWVRVNLGSKFWQSRWERRLHIVEESLGESLDLFSASWQVICRDVCESLRSTMKPARWPTKIYNKLVLRKPSVSKSMTMLSTAFALGWAAAALISIGSLA